MGPKLAPWLREADSDYPAGAWNLNERMHPRNVFRERPPDFARLAAKYPGLAARCRPHATPGRVHLDFKSPETVRQLTIAILADEFGLHVDLPPDSLVPRVPSRLNYVLWLQDLLAELPPSHPPSTSRADSACPASTASETQPSRFGVDIGTGASAIYPLLGARLCGWRFLATEKDPDSVASARRNVAANGLEDRVRVVEASESVPLKDLLPPDAQLDFLMCNPPFFAPDQVTPGPLLRRAEAEGGRPRRAPPHSVTVAKACEVAADGGEVAFVGRLLQDSLHLRTRVRIYTSLLGRKSSLAPLKEALRRAGVVSMAQTTLFQGRTPRWALAWTFVEGLRLASPPPPPAADKPSLIRLRAPPAAGLAQLRLALRDVLASLDVAVEEGPGDSWLCSAAANTWAGARRKRRAAKAAAASPAKRARTEACRGEPPGSQGQEPPRTPLEHLGPPLPSAKAVPGSEERQCPVLEFRLWLAAAGQGGGPVEVALEKVSAASKDFLNQLAQHLRNRLQETFAQP